MPVASPPAFDSKPKIESDTNGETIVLAKWPKLRRTSEDLTTANTITKQSQIRIASCLAFRSCHSNTIDL